MGAWGVVVGGEDVGRFGTILGVPEVLTREGRVVRPGTKVLANLNAPVLGLGLQGTKNRE